MFHVGLVVIASILFALAQSHSVILGLDPEILLQNFEKCVHNMRTCVSVT
jgi:hypothetical protein